MGDAVTPSAQIIAEANATETVTDIRGRQIVIRRLRGRALARFIRACGPSADVATYFGQALLRAYVVAIDGMPLAMPTNIDQVDSLFDRVDNDAVQAIADHLAPSEQTEDLSPP